MSLRDPTPPSRSSDEAQSSPEVARLHQLARLWGVATRYRDGFGQLRRPSADTLLTTLTALGAPLMYLSDVPGALADRRRRQARRVLPPTAVSWGGRSPILPLTVPARAAGAPVTLVLQREDGGTEEQRLDPATTPVVGRRGDGEGEDRVRRRLRWPGEMPPGWHRLTVRVADPRGGEITGSLRLVAAPEGLPREGAGTAELRQWGVFLPLHALVERPGSGLGNLGSLARLSRWAGGRGASLVGCLPLLAAFLDADQRPFDVSPYAPASRLFWNELWVDLGILPELAESPAARRRLGEPGMMEERRRLAALEHVDYGAERAWRRPVWQSLAERFFQHAPEGRRQRFEAFRRSRPEVESYARFRALGDLHGTPWQEWPAAHRRLGRLAPGGDGEGAHLPPEAHRHRRRHLYAQWHAHAQMSRLGSAAEKAGVELYLDLPLGVHAASWETWRHPAAFVPEVTVGAPPDAFFTDGQNWGFPPPAPLRAAARGDDRGEAALELFRATVRHSLEASGVLRLDHVMQLERLFWIPPGGEPADGTYVAYPREELLATVVLEASRAGTAVVGEDLGTVPPAVRRGMAKRGLARMYVLPFEIRPGGIPGLTPVPDGALASLGTHDTATFRGFWEGRDLGLRRRLGLLSEYRQQELRRLRADERQALLAELRRRGLLGQEDEELPSVVLGALLALAQSPASRVLVQLEDLWGEGRPQNVPGTGPERPNWRRRARLSLAEMAETPAVVHALDALEIERPALLRSPPTGGREEGR